MTVRAEMTIELVLYSVGIHYGIPENFKVLEFGGADDKDVMYFESVRDSIFSHDATEDITVYREPFEELRSMSLGPKGTLDYLAESADAIRCPADTTRIHVNVIFMQEGSMFSIHAVDFRWRISS